VADWAAIEARANPWLSGVGQAKLDLFRTGADVYKVNAAATFGVGVADVTKDQRQIGKVQELACGFAGGVGAFAAMGRAYGVLLPESDARRMVVGLLLTGKLLSRHIFGPCETKTASSKQDA